MCDDFGAVGRSELARFDDAALHHGQDSLPIFQNRNVGDHVTVNHEHIAPFAGLERPELITTSHNLGTRLRSALDRIEGAEAHGTYAKELSFFVTALSVQRETGGNLTETLENLADVLRKRRQMKLKVRAMSSEARASAMIIGSLPFIMFVLIYLVNQRYIMMLFNDPRGMVITGIGLGLMVVGGIIMAKMVRFEI